MEKIDFKRVKVPFTQVANVVLNDKNLSAKAKGLYAYLYSKPEGWNFAAERIAQDSTDGERGIRGGLIELEERGYLIREKQKTGRIVYTIVHNAKLLKPKCAFRQSGKTAPISNKEYISNKEINKSFSKKSDEIDPLLGFPLPEGHELIDYGFDSDDTHNWVLQDEYGVRISPSKIAQMRKTYQNGKKTHEERKDVTTFNFESFLTIWNGYPDLKSVGLSSVNNPSAKKVVLPPAKLTPDLQKLIKQYARKYDLSLWEHAISEYVKDILNRSEDATGYYLHRMSFYDFLYQKNGFTKFVNK